ncbi:MAG TPA: hypothetical protein VN517_13240 [Terriglobales bacterium]|nr:hypothetical protein [Terriglobales bacterium]
MIAIEQGIDEVVQADEGVPPDIACGLKPIVTKLREYSGNQSLCLEVRCGPNREYQITLSSNRADTTFTVTANSNVLKEVQNRLLGPVEESVGVIGVQDRYERLC